MITPSSPFLTARAPVPIDRPFTSSWARAQGVDPRHLRAWVRAGLLVAPVHGVLHAAQLADCLELRIECLRLVVPEDAVVTDRTAAWLHGHRWCCSQAMCSMLKVSDFTADDIRAQADGRFKGHRWVRQLRALIPLCDPRFESPGECILALIWHETPGLPPFEPQWQVSGPDGYFYLDLAVPALHYAAEYNGAEFHGEDRLEADQARRTWLEDSGGWRFGVFVAADVSGTGQFASDRLMSDIAEARRTFASRRRVVL